MDANNLESLGNLFESRMKEYEDRLNKVAGGSSLHPDIAALSQEFAEFRKLIWQIFTKIKADMDSLSLGLDRHEMIMRRKVLLFHGIAEKPDEQLPDVIHKVISEQMKVVDIHKNHVRICHRLGASAQDRSRPILVRFYDLDHKQAVWDSKTSLKGTGITVSEFLTKTRHQVFTSARRHFGVRNCWSMDGNILIILPDKSRRKIDNMASLQEIISKFPNKSVDVDATAQNKAEIKAASKGTRSNRRRN